MTREETIRKLEEEIRRLQVHQDTFRTKIDSTVRRIDELTHDRFVSDDCRAARAGDLAEIKALYESLLAAAQRQVASLEQAMAAAVAEKKRSEEIEEQKRREKKATEAQDSGGGAGAGRDLGKEAQEPVSGGQGGAGAVSTEATSASPASARASGGISTGASSGGIGTSNLSVLDNPSAAVGGQAHPSSLLDDAIAAVIGGFAVEEIRTHDPLAAGKLRDKLEEAGRKAKALSQEALSALRKTFATQGMDLHDLSKEQSAAGKLMKDKGFEGKTIGEKAAGVNGFFAEQDKLRDAGWANVQQKAEELLSQIHGHMPNEAHAHDREQLANEVKSARGAEHAGVMAWRGEFVQGLCKEAAEKKVAQDNQQALQNYEKVLEDRGKEAHADLRKDLALRLDLNAPPKVEQTAAEYHDKHFPQIPTPSVESKSVSAPAVETPALAGPGPGSGPGGGR